MIIHWMDRGFYWLCEMKMAMSMYAVLALLFSVLVVQSSETRASQVSSAFLNSSAFNAIGHVNLDLIQSFVTSHDEKFWAFVENMKKSDTIPKKNRILRVLVASNCKYQILKSQEKWQSMEAFLNYLMEILKFLYYGRYHVDMNGIMEYPSDPEFERDMPKRRYFSNEKELVLDLLMQCIYDLFVWHDRANIKFSPNFLDMDTNLKMQSFERELSLLIDGKNNDSTVDYDLSYEYDADMTVKRLIISRSQRIPALPSKSSQSNNNNTTVLYILSAGLCATIQF